MRPIRTAAVLLAIFADPPYSVVFVERAAHLRDHPGQIGLPGGRVEHADGDDRALTALRELDEELGVPRERVTIVGRLPDVHQSTNNFIVSPFIGILAPATPLRIDTTETAAVHTVPLEALVAPGAVRRGIERIGDRTVETWQFDHRNLHVWGLTGGILQAFVGAWHESESTLRAALECRLRARVS